MSILLKSEITSATNYTQNDTKYIKMGLNRANNKSMHFALF